MRENARHPRGMPPGGEPAGSWRPRRWHRCRPPDLRCPQGVRGRLNGDLAYTTVVTLLSRLHTKGVLGRKAARGFLYQRVADEPGLAARRVAQHRLPETVIRRGPGAAVVAVGAVFLGLGLS